MNLDSRIFTQKKPENRELLDSGSCGQRTMSGSLKLQFDGVLDRAPTPLAQRKNRGSRSRDASSSSSSMASAFLGSIAISSTSRACMALLRSPVTAASATSSCHTKSLLENPLQHQRRLSHDEGSSAPGLGHRFDLDFGSGGQVRNRTAVRHVDDADHTLARGHGGDDLHGPFAAARVFFPLRQLCFVEEFLIVRQERLPQLLGRWLFGRQGVGGAETVASRRVGHIVRQVVLAAGVCGERIELERVAIVRVDDAIVRMSAKGPPTLHGRWEAVFHACASSAREARPCRDGGRG